MSATLLDFQAMNVMPQRAMGAAITHVCFQICDVNHKQLTDCFCKRSLVCISYKRALLFVRN